MLLVSDCFLMYLVLFLFQRFSVEVPLAEYVLVFASVLRLSRVQFVLYDGILAPREVLSFVYCCVSSTWSSSHDGGVNE